MITSLHSILKDLFYGSSYTIYYIRRDKIKVTILVNIYIIRYCFINDKFEYKVY